MKTNSCLYITACRSKSDRLLGATINPSPPDGKFFTWSGQFQWAWRLPYWDSEVLFRSDVQLASEALLSLEKLPVGGANSVRGYRENQLVRDNGWLSSLEPTFRTPLVEVAYFTACLAN